MAIRRIGVDGTVSRQSVDLLGNRRGEVQGFNVVERDGLRIGDDLDYLGRPAVVEVVDTENLAQLHFMQSEIGLDGIIRDETPGRGTDRSELIGRCVNFNGTTAYAGSPQAFGTVQAVSFWMKADSVTGTKWGPVDLSATQRFRVIDGVISVVNVTGTIYIDGQQSTTVTTGWHHVLATFSSAISATGFIGLVNGQGFFGGLVSDVQFLPRAITAAEALAGYQDPENWLPDVARTAWYKCESQHPTLLLDSSGNDRHATCSNHNATVGNFFYEGNDVPGSYLNKVGHLVSDGSSHYAYNNGTGLIPSGVVVPRSEANKASSAAFTLAGASVPLQYIGEAPRHARLENNNCGTFDGSNDYVDLDSSSTLCQGATPWTFSVRVRPTRSTADVEYILAKGNTGQWSWALFKQTTNHNCSFEMWSSGGSAVYDVAVVGGFVLNEWQTITVTWSGSVLSVYRNGVLIGSDNTATGTLNTVGTATVRVGARGDLASTEFQGSICDLRFLDGTAISAAEALAVHELRDTVSWTRWLPFSEGKGTDLHNVVPGGAHGSASGIDETTFWGTKQNVFAYNSAMGSSYDAGKYIPARNDSSGLDALGNPLTYAPSPGVWPLSEATLNSNPNNAPRRGTPGPTAFHPVSAPGSNPTFFRRRTKNSQLVGIDRFVHYEETLDGARLTKAQTFTTEKPL